MLAHLVPHQFSSLPFKRLFHFVLTLFSKATQDHANGIVVEHRNKLIPVDNLFYMLMKESLCALIEICLNDLQ